MVHRRYSRLMVRQPMCQQSGPDTLQMWVGRGNRYRQVQMLLCRRSMPSLYETFSQCSQRKFKKCSMYLQSLLPIRIDFIRFLASWVRLILRNIRLKNENKNALLFTFCVHGIFVVHEYSCCLLELAIGDYEVIQEGQLT